MGLPDVLDDLRERPDAVEAGHADIEHREIGSELLGQRVRVGRLSDDLEAAVGK